MVTFRQKDVQRYNSPTDCNPKHLIVQATQEVYESHPTGDWRRAKIKGNVAIILRISEWALAPSNQDDKGDRHFFVILSGILSMSCRVFLVSTPLMIVLSLPIEKVWMDLDFQKTYTEVPYYYWDYPESARNSLDMQPSPGKQGNQSIIRRKLPIHDMKMELQSVFKLSGQTFLVIDALDECPIDDEDKRRNKVLALLAELSEWAVPNLHVLVTSRKEPDIDEALAPLVSFSSMSIQTNQVQPDIYKYIKSQLANDVRLKKFKEEIENTLFEQAHGM